MIGLRDSLTLARTKVRSKRIRLLITTIVSGLLFGLIGGGVLLFDGTADSVDRFAAQNLGGRYLVQGTPLLPSDQIYPNPGDPAIRREVETLHAAYLAERRAAAVRYGITDYDPRTEVPPIVDDPYGDPSIPADQRKTANPESVAWKRREAAAIEKLQQSSAATPEKFAADSRAAGATDTYRPRSLQQLGLTYLKDGREDLSATAQTDEGSNNGGFAGPEGESSIASSNFTLVDDELVAAFIDEPNGARATPRGIPVLVPIDDVVATFGRSLGVTKRPKDSSGQVAWYRDVRARANGVTFTTCYRNQAERDRVDDARSTAAEIAANKDTRGFEMPALVLELPTTTCGPVTVASDTRTAREKEKEANQRAFDAVATSTAATQGAPQEVPKAELLTFQIVGVLPTGQSGGGGLESLVSSIVGTTYGYGSIIPSGLLEQVPEDLRHTQVLDQTPTVTPESVMMFGPTGPEAAFISSFRTVEQARTFIAGYSCGDDGGFLGGDYYSECGKPFSVGTYGTNYLVVDDIGREARPFLIGILGALFAVATIIIWAMMGRVIADSRRETAVFRAIGAKRSDIIKIYLLYSLWVALRIALFAAALASVIVLVVETLFSRRATDAAQLAYGVFNDASFHFFGVPSPLFWAILGGILMMSLVAITPPLLRNIRRNPIRDMRDE